MNKIVSNYFGFRLHYFKGFRILELSIVNPKSPFKLFQCVSLHLLKSLSELWQRVSNLIYIFSRQISLFKILLLKGAAQYLNKKCIITFGLLCMLGFFRHLKEIILFQFFVCYIIPSLPVSILWTVTSTFFVFSLPQSSAPPSRLSPSGL